MTTLIVDITDSEQAARVADALRLMKSVKKVFVREEDFERIPGLPCTEKELKDSVTKAMAGYRRGEKGITQQELRKQIASWK
jgi:hypothetical protein